MMRSAKKAVINRNLCVSCGCCVKVCPRGAISVPNGVYAVINEEMCVGCGLCAKECPASVIGVKEVTGDEN